MANNRDIRELLDKIVNRTRNVTGVHAIVLGGSRASGTADSKSDIDLGIYYDSDQPIAVAELSRAAEDLDDRHEPGLVTALGEWGPGVNGGGWLIIDGLHVDFLYRDLHAVRDAIDQCRAGRPRTLHQLGHPLGFHNQIYAGEVSCCIPLYDPHGTLAELKSRISEYPEPLRTALIRKHLFDAGFELTIAEKAAVRRDVMYVSGCLFRAAGFMTLVVHALNRQWFINEKGALARCGGFALVPASFRSIIEHTLGSPGRDSPELAASIAHLKQLLGELTNLASA